ncbi:MAG: 16S rRNA processing protein RimM [Ruminococcaceae bacterium]|nr:16S rRNA processing protein RimM [Oscillospiraceae bacterium]
MKKEFLEAGKIVGTHGVAGMVRIQSWCDSNEFFCKFKKLFLNENGTGEIIVSSSKPHGNVVIAKLKGYDSIDAAETLRNKVVYVNRNQMNLEKGAYLIQDLIGCSVFDIESGAFLGKISDVSKTGANDVWHIENDGREYLIPKIDDIVKLVDIDNEKIMIKPIKGIFDDEN